MELLQQLTVCDPVPDEVLQKRFEEFKSYGDDHTLQLRDATREESYRLSCGSCSFNGLLQALRLADMLLYSWKGGLDVCVDLIGSSPQTGMVDFVLGRAVIDVAQRKRGKYMAKYADIGYCFLHFSFFSFWELEKDAATLYRKFFMAQDSRARAAVHIFNRISFFIAKGVGAQIVFRLPSNLL
ncbi:hypothetical protein Tco_1363740 [Tanacetum coccineum]